MDSNSVASTDSICFKAGFAPLTTLVVGAHDLNTVKEWLINRQKEAPALFQNLPCSIDLYNSRVESLPLPQLIDICRSVGLMPIGARNVSSDFKQSLLTLGLADFGRSSKRHINTTKTDDIQLKTPEPATTPAHNEPNAANTGETHIDETSALSRHLKIHQGNIRSGQQMFIDGDLIILGMVSAGAEVLATGDIHIYGALRGRALAGVKGDAQSCISCQNFDAELVAVAGQYRLFEEAPEFQQKAAVIRLVDDHLNIEHVS